MQKSRSNCSFFDTLDSWALQFHEGPHISIYLAEKVWNRSVFSVSVSTVSNVFFSYFSSEISRSLASMFAQKNMFSSYKNWISQKKNSDWSHILMKFFLIWRFSDQCSWCQWFRVSCLLIWTKHHNLESDFNSWTQQILDQTKHLSINTWLKTHVAQVCKNIKKLSWWEIKIILIVRNIN